MNTLKQEWLGNIKGDVLAGIVVFMALIPEVMGFMIVAGVDPMVGVYATFCITIVTAIFGGRPGLISAAAGAMALVLASLVRDYGIEYMLAATILTGILQVIFGFLKIGNLLKFIPKPVMHGFVNSLGIMMFTSQLEHFQGNPILLILGGIGISIIYLFPKITKKIPSPIVAISVVTAIVLMFNIYIKTLGDMGRLTSDLPKFITPNVPFNLETLSIIFPYASSLSSVGIVESLLT
ncbi:MAG: SulP family inorganic anion transporter, partial [Turicibacter sp.]|nr:SulP family inorganic anion transporter [Turicibacter sp.]